MGSLFLLLFVLLMLVMLVMSSRKQRKAYQETMDFLDTLTPGTEVKTRSGLLGTVTLVQEELISLEIAPGVVTIWEKGAIQPLSAATPTTKAEEKKIESEEKALENQHSSEDEDK